GVKYGSINYFALSYFCDNGGSSRESIANLLDEGLGTSLDGTDEISSSIHSTLGRNDS
ncbi:unnamed protein product, partial [Allacma fusca]